MSLDLITENENKLEILWQNYKNCLELTNTGECDDQEFIELGKAANHGDYKKN